MTEPMTVVDRLVAATNAHDLDALQACFASDYVNETPAHPERGFQGNEQVRTNWQMIFSFVPDIAAEVVASAVDGDTVWSEWVMRGTKPDGSRHEMAGVICFTVGEGVITRARFYLEPIDRGSGDVNDAIRAVVSEEVSR